MRGGLLTGAAGILVLAGLAGCNSGTDPVLDAPSDVDRCRERMAVVYRGLREYREREGGAPQASGVGFFATLIAAGIWEDTPENREQLTCPGPGAQPQAAGSFADVSALDGSHSAYAGRDLEAHPLEKFPTGGMQLEVLLACDGAEGMNHAGVLNALFADGTIKSYVIEELIARGDLSADTSTIAIGPDSPLPDLRKLKVE